MNEQTIGSCDPRVRVPVAIATVWCRHGNRRVGDSSPAIAQQVTDCICQALPVEQVSVIYSNSPGNSEIGLRLRSKVRTFLFPPLYD